MLDDNSASLLYSVLFGSHLSNATQSITRAELIEGT